MKKLFLSILLLVLSGLTFASSTFTVAQANLKSSFSPITFKVNKYNSFSINNALDKKIAVQITTNGMIKITGSSCNNQTLYSNTSTLCSLDPGSQLWISSDYEFYTNGTFEIESK